ncbi:molybdate ABC transporter substrate-binding protein [Roseibium algae]|uniref:Molybdate ABC transporter substrate-binding protein n=1 Tax=Roseibium algae TaxID=3123038 RepID=A0ABU8TN98_9HYPH
MIVKGGKSSVLKRWNYARKFGLIKALAVMLVGSFMSLQANASEKITVFAAASLTDALSEIGKVFQQGTGTEVVFSFAGTGTLARQVEAGAPADIFVSADEAWMIYVQEKGAVNAATMRIIAGNDLVLIGSAEAAPLSLTAKAIAGRLGDGRLVMADPETVPAGRYAKAALEATGLWATVSGHLAPMDNVRVVLASVARGDAPLGIVYGSDAKVEPKVAVLAEFPEETHPKIRYPAAETVIASIQAAAFMEFLTGPKAQAIFRSKGFSGIE